MAKARVSDGSTLWRHASPSTFCGRGWIYARSGGVTPRGGGFTLGAVELRLEGVDLRSERWSYA
eukprot:1192766-Prorocentrum_minimum.AAC.4